MADEGDPVGPTELFTLVEHGEHEPCEIAGRLVDDLEEFAYLRTGEAVILFLMRVEPKIKAQRMILGEMCLPRFMGSLASLGTWLLAKVCGDVPDFIMLLDTTWWQQAPPIAREALVYHELMHAAHAVDKEGEPRFTPEGMPIWDIKGHDLEEFDAVVRRYGAWKGDIQSFIKALRDGGAI
jgi:hypothetical protein